MMSRSFEKLLHHRAQAPATAPRPRSPLVAVVALGTTARVIDWILGWVLSHRLPPAPPKIPHGFHPPASSLFALHLWSNWDGLWYLSIAHLGYHGRPVASAFFPVYPILLAALGDTVVAGIVLSWASFLIGLGFLWPLIAERYGHRTAWYAIIGLITLPTAFFYGAVYTESLFFATASATLYYLQRRAYAVSAVIAGLASAVSIYGVLLSGAFLTALLRDPKARSKKRSWLFLLITPWGLCAYMGFLYEHFDHPLMFERVQPIWGRHRSLPWTTFVRGFDAARRANHALASPHLWTPSSHAATLSLNAWNFDFYVFALGLLLVAGWRLPIEWTVYALASLVLPLLAAATHEPLMSFPRLFLASIPLIPALGIVLARSRYLFFAYLFGALWLGGWMLARFISFRWVA